MKIFYCPCKSELNCNFYNPRTGRCEMDDPGSYCDAAFYATKEANKNQLFCPGARKGGMKPPKPQRKQT